MRFTDVAFASGAGPRLAIRMGLPHICGGLPVGEPNRREDIVMIETYVRTKTLRHAIGAMLLVFTLSSTTEAGPLEVNLDPYPVVLAGFITSSYDAATGDFLANGWTLSLNQ